ncbi:MAG: response regulator [Deltaproteobacteria bacterium]|nr:response regulator [Deltaproteobacteria bacterium]
MIYATVIKSTFGAPSSSSSSWRDLGRDNLIKHDFSGKTGATPINKKSELRILIVDGDRASLASLYQGLMATNESYHIGSSSSAEDALKILSRISIDVLVSSMRLSGMSGLELLRQVRKVSPKTRCILTTEIGENVIIDDESKSHLAALLQKPFSIEALVNYIEPNISFATDIDAKLHDVSVLDLFEVYLNRKAKVALKVRCGNTTGMVLCNDGFIVHAEFDFQRGADALAAIIIGRNTKIEAGSDSVDVIFRRAAKQLLAVGVEELRQARSCSSPLELVNLFKATEVVASNALGIDKPSRVFAADKPGKCAIGLDRGTKDTSQISKICRELRDFTLDELVLQPEAESSERSKDRIEDFSSRDLILQTEASAPEHFKTPKVDEEKLEKVRHLVAMGIEHFRARSFKNAQKAWQLALEIDPDCKEAKNNLKILESLPKPKTC